jgi:hypothetical protein
MVGQFQKSHANRKHFSPSSTHISNNEDTIMLGETAMVGFCAKMAEENLREKRLLRINKNRKRFGGLFARNKRKSLVSSQTSAGGSSFDSDSLCSEGHDECVRKVAGDTEMFRKMQETLRESKFTTNQGIKHALVKYFDEADIAML